MSSFAGQRGAQSESGTQDGWMVTCPAHEDRHRPRFTSARVKRGAFCLECHAGCEQPVCARGRPAQTGPMYARRTATATDVSRSPPSATRMSTDELAAARCRCDTQPNRPSGSDTRTDAAGWVWNLAGRPAGALPAAEGGRGGPGRHDHPCEPRVEKDVHALERAGDGCDLQPDGRRQGKVASGSTPRRYAARTSLPSSPTVTRRVQSTPNSSSSH